jgi:hypothetical protein
MNQAQQMAEGGTAGGTKMPRVGLRDEWPGASVRRRAPNRWLSPPGNHFFVKPNVRCRPAQTS